MYLQWDPSSCEHTGLHTSHRPETVKRDGNKWANAAHVVIRGKQESRSNLNYFNRPHLDNRKAECILCWFLCLWIASHCGLPAGSHVVLDVEDSDRSGTAWCFITPAEDTYKWDRAVLLKVVKESECVNVYRECLMVTLGFLSFSIHRLVKLYRFIDSLIIQRIVKSWDFQSNFLSLGSPHPL